MKQFHWATVFFISLLANADDPIPSFDGAVCSDVAITISGQNVTIDSSGAVGGTITGAITGNCDTVVSVAHDEHAHITPPPPPPSPSGTTCNGVYLGVIPFAVECPVMPVITQEISVTNEHELYAAAKQPGTRIIVSADIPNASLISGSDVEVVATGYQLGQMTLEHSSHRVRFIGGQYQRINVNPPTVWWPAFESNPAWFSTDVSIQDVSFVNPSGIAISVGGKRVAILNNTCQVRDYCIWGTSDLGIEDLIVAGNHFVTQGVQANIRLVSITRSVVVENYLESLVKHNYRIHGISDLIYAARNTLVGAGALMGGCDAPYYDQIGQVWHHNNVHHHIGNNSTFQVGEWTPPSQGCTEPFGVQDMDARNNILYSDIAPFWTYGTPPGHWIDENNQVFPYQPYAP